MTRTKVFYNNRTQAVRLPKGVAFPEGVTEVEIRAEGDTRVITPVYRSWADWWENGTRPSDDFIEIMMTRDQPPPQERDWW